jgi:DNA-binding CsgD family transcriptional regulator
VVGAARFKRLERRLRERDLEMLRLMSDGAAWGLRALARALGWSTHTVAYHLRRLVERGEVEAITLKRASRKKGGVEEVRVYRERGEVEAITLKRASRKKGGVEEVRVYRITPRGLWTLGRGIPAPESPREPEEPPPGAPALQLAIHIVAWSKYAARALLHLHERGEDSMYGLCWAMTGHRYTAGNWPRLWGLLYRLREWGLVEWELVPANHPRYQYKYRFRITERGREVARAILAVAGELLAAREAGGPPRPAETERL